MSDPQELNKETALKMAQQTENDAIISGSAEDWHQAAEYYKAAGDRWNWSRCVSIAVELEL